MKLSDVRAFVNPVVGGLLVTLGVGGSVGLGTVWMRHQVSVVADSNAALVRQIAEVERQIADVNASVERSMRNDVLREKNEVMALGLVELNQTQIRAVNEDPVHRLVARANQRVFAREGAPMIGFRLPTEQTAPAAAPANTLPGVPAASGGPAFPPTRFQLASSR